MLAGAAWGGTPGPARNARRRSVSSAPAITPALAGGRASYADIVKVVAPAVVTIRVEGKAAVVADRRFRRRTMTSSAASSAISPDTVRGSARSHAPRTFRQRGLGSGVVVSGDGYILTNHHVIDDADDITVEFTDGHTFKAKVIGSDQPSDLAVLKIEADEPAAVTLANSDDAQVGDVVLAVGNPLGVGQTVTMGIVSAKGRQTGWRRAIRTSSRPTRRSTRATRAARW